MSDVLERRLGLFDTTAVVIGAIIGVGIFFTPAEVARLAGSPERAMWVWALGGLVALLGALTFAELGRRFPRAGGQYEVLRSAWGPATAFVYTFCVQTAVLPGSAALIALVTAFNLSLAVHGVPPDWEQGTPMAAALVVGVALANAAGVRAGAGIQNVTVVSKVLTLLAIAALALFVGAPAPVATAPSAMDTTAAAGSSLFVALLPAMFSYGGWQQGLWMGGEVKDAERTLPRALVAGVAVVVAVYLLAAWAYFDLLGYAGVIEAKALAAEAVDRVYPDVGGRVVAAAVAVSALGVLNVQFLTGPRLTYAVAADGRFFAMFARVHARSGTPVAAIALLGALTLGALAVGTDAVGSLTAWIVVLDALFFGLTGLALLKLGARGPLWWLCAGGFAALEWACVFYSVFDDKVRASAVAGALWVLVAVAASRLTRARSART